MKHLALFFSLLFIPLLCHAADQVQRLDLTASWVGITSLLLFFAAYMVVMSEEIIQLRKSKPVVLVAGVLWALIAWYYQTQGIPDLVENALRHNLEEYAELMLFLLVAMTFIVVLDERNVFEALRSWLIRKGFSYRTLFWVTGFLAFFISPIADNLTTALVMSAVVMAVGKNDKKFIMISCVSIVVAANAGGAFSPFGDITTLMVWQKNIHAYNGAVDFWAFFALFFPSLVNWLIPASIMHFYVPNKKPESSDEVITMRRGAITIMVLFLITISLAVSAHSVLHLPPVIGMLTGLGLLQFFSYYLKRKGEKSHLRNSEGEQHAHPASNPVPFDIYNKISRAEWDTLFFFYGVIMCVGALGFIGYLTMISQTMYAGWGATYANISVGFISAIVDNIPVMFAVLSMMPDMSVGQWLLLTLTAGVGGSMLSIGSAAGVALMGQARGAYTFFGHLKWTPVIVLGYLASVIVHIKMNQHLF